MNLPSSRKESKVAEFLLILYAANSHYFNEKRPRHFYSFPSTQIIDAGCELYLERVSDKSIVCKQNLNLTENSFLTLPCGACMPLRWKGLSAPLHTSSALWPHSTSLIHAGWEVGAEDLKAISLCSDIFRRHNLPPRVSYT